MVWVMVAKSCIFLHEGHQVAFFSKKIYNFLFFLIKILFVFYVRLNTKIIFDNFCIKAYRNRWDNKIFI